MPWLLHGLGKGPEPSKVAVLELKTKQRPQKRIPQKLILHEIRRMGEKTVDHKTDCVRGRKKRGIEIGVVVVNQNCQNCLGDVVVAVAVQIVDVGHDEQDCICFGNVSWQQVVGSVVVG